MAVPLTGRRLPGKEFISEQFDIEIIHDIQPVLAQPRVKPERASLS